MARRRHRRNPARKYKVKHVVIKKNPRRRRRNPEGGFGETGELLPVASGTKIPAAAESPIGPMFGPARPPRGYRKQQAQKKKAERAAEAKRLRRLAASSRKGAKGKGVVAMAKRAQAQRLEAIAAVLEKRGKAVQKSPLVKAMSVKSNPGFAGVVEAAKILLPQAAVGSVGLVGLAMAGNFVAGMIAQTKDEKGNVVIRDSFKTDGKVSPVVPYIPAISTAAISAAAYMVADKVAPKYKGAIAIGGMLGAAIQAVLAAASGPDVKADSLLGKAKSALTLGEYTTVGSGIFRGIGEYTTVGNAHPFRPRNYGDDQMQWAALGETSIQPPGGRDNSTEFAPGEGGIFAKASIMDRASKMA